MTERAWYEIRNAAADEAEVLIYDQIGESFWSEGVTAKAFAEDLKAITAPAIALRINSPGGSVFDGLAIYNALERHPAKVTTYVDGLAASIASVIALAGERVVMAANALYMIHNPYTVAIGDAAEMRKTADTLDKIRDTMLGTYRSRTSMSEDELVAAMDAETWYTAEEALAAGFADAVTEPAQRAAAAFDLSRFRNVPATLNVAATAATTPAPANPKEVPAVNDTPAVAQAADDTITLGPVYTRPAALPTVAEYVIASGQQDAARLADFRRRILAAAPDTQLADVAGIIPTPIVAPVISLKDSQAPLFSALGVNAAPDGGPFTIPKITTDLTDAAAAAEGTDVSAQLVIGDTPVTMHFIKRAANISYEAVQYSNPGVVNVAVERLADAVVRGSENVVKTAIEAATGTNTGVAVKADGSDAWAKLAAGVAAFYSACGQLPDVFAAAPDVWAALAGMTNSLGQPLVNGVSQNLGGSWGTLFGVPVYVSPAMTAGKSFLLSSYGVKSWAAGPVNLQLSQPTTFEYQLGAGRSVGCSIADGKFITPVTVTAAP